MANRYDDSVRSSLITIAASRIADDEEFEDVCQVIKKLNVTFISEAFEQSLHKNISVEDAHKVEDFLDSELYRKYNMAVYKASAAIGNDIAALAQCLLATDKEKAH